jgi:hypothetical protein
LMQDFVETWGVDLSAQIDLAAAMATQVEEITGSGKGQVKLAVDQMLEQLAIMVEKDIAKKEIDFTFTRMTRLPEGKVFDPEKNYLAISMKNAVQTFTANAWRIGYQGEILDEDSYTKQLRTVDYTAKLNHQKRFKPYGCPNGGVNKKCVVIDLQAAAEKGLEVSGFFAVDQKCDADEEDDSGKKTGSAPASPPRLNLLETKM